MPSLNSKVSISCAIFVLSRAPANVPIGIALRQGLIKERNTKAGIEVGAVLGGKPGLPDVYIKHSRFPVLIRHD